jgi:hypothetical protein
MQPTHACHRASRYANSQAITTARDTPPFEIEECRFNTSKRGRSELSVIIRSNINRHLWWPDVLKSDNVSGALIDGRSGTWVGSGQRRGEHLVEAQI